MKVYHTGESMQPIEVSLQTLDNPGELSPWVTGTVCIGMAIALWLYPNVRGAFQEGSIGTMAAVGGFSVAGDNAGCPCRPWGKSSGAPGETWRQPRATIVRERGGCGSLC